MLSSIVGGTASLNTLRNWLAQLNRSMRMIVITHDVEIGGLSLGLGRVDLAQVPAPVRLLDVVDVKVPRPMILVRHF